MPSTLLEPSNTESSQCMPLRHIIYAAFPIKAISGIFIFIMAGVFYVIRQRRMPGDLLVLPEIRYDQKISSQRKFDIVISLYAEDLSDVYGDLSEIFSIPEIRATDPTIHAYTKHPLANLSEIRTQLSLPSEKQIRRLPNRGREGGTYLSHILSYWDDLADHTLFVQGSVHNFGHFKQRLEDYFNRTATGYLPLGFSGILCQVTDCTDPWGWHDDYGHLASLYAAIYGQLPPSHKIQLSYKGQFVVSARRIRGVKKSLYRNLLDMLEGDMSPFSHNKLMLKNAMMPERYRYDAPVFGYTLERMWGLVFQCAQGEMAIKCPSSKRRTTEELHACQCLDVMDPGLELARRDLSSISDP